MSLTSFGIAIRLLGFQWLLLRFQSFSLGFLFQFLLALYRRFKLGAEKGNRPVKTFRESYVQFERNRSRKTLHTVYLYFVYFPGRTSYAVL